MSTFFKGVIQQMSVIFINEFFATSTVISLRKGTASGALGHPAIRFKAAFSKAAVVCPYCGHTSLLTLTGKPSTPIDASGRVLNMSNTCSVSRKLGKRHSRSLAASA
jgi:hypothetical protein